MLSNKLTFSLASLVVLLVAGLCFTITADAAESVLVPDNGDADRTLEAGANLVLASDGKTAANAMLMDTDTYANVAAAAEATHGDIPDLVEFFSRDWMIEIVVAKGSDIGWKELAISEIMWGLDIGIEGTGGGQIAATAGGEAGRQWIELYNASGDDITIAAIDDAPAALTDDSIFILFWHPESDDFPVYNHINAVATAHDADNPDTPDDTDVSPLDLIYSDRAEKVDADHTHVVVDRVTNLDYHKDLGFRGRWAAIPGQSGRTTAPTAIDELPQVELISANRKINYSAAKAVDGVPDGHAADSWEATDPFARRNTTDSLIVASPGVGVDPFQYVAGAATADGAANKIVINEIHNNSNNDLDWIEIKNVMEPGSEDSDINIENWEIAKVVASADAGKDTTEVVVDLPKYVLGAQEILLIVGRDPGETILAGGVNVEVLGDLDLDQLNKGAQHHYYIPEDGLSLPTGKSLLILRDNHEKNAAGKYHENIQDAAGGLEEIGYEDDRTGATLVFPFKSKASLDGDKAPDAFGDENNGVAWARKPKGLKAGYYIVDNPNGRHKGAWGDPVTGATTMGVGYDREVDLNFAPGTPGYENMIANTVDDHSSTDPDPDGMEIAADMISISEIMYDAGPRWNQVQWIELYNASLTQAVNVKGWELEIRNATDAVESYVDSSFIFNDAVILPNQTLLIVSGPGANDVPENRVYNLFAQHRRELGLTNRRSVLLSPDGFYLKLTDKADINRDHRTDQDEVVDEAGNVSVDGASRTVAWELPERGDIRQSLIRQYGSRELDGSPDPADLGTVADSWVLSDVSGAGLAYFGHRDDVGTPGYRLGGPLPVSLASFRPVRDKATGEVVITWVTESELNNAGFNILRAESKDGEFQIINLTGIIAGHGTTSEKHVYSYTDKTAKPNVAYYYQIEDVSLNGNRTTLRTTHMRGNVNASGKLTTTWSNLKLQK